MEKKPVIFSGEMVKAILEGRKTQTRLVIKPQPKLKTYNNPEQKFWIWKDCNWLDGGIGLPSSGIEDHAPYKPGDVLYVKETWRSIGFVASFFEYKADFPHESVIPWKSPILMPKRAARIFLRVVDVSVERLQKITSTDMWNEGCLPENINQEEIGVHDEWLQKYWIPLWNRTNAKRGYTWESNPWVWVIEFERTEKP